MLDVVWQRMERVSHRIDTPKEQSVARFWGLGIKGAERLTQVVLYILTDHPHSFHILQPQIFYDEQYPQQTLSRTVNAKN